MAILQCDTIRSNSLKSVGCKMSLLLGTVMLSLIFIFVYWGYHRNGTTNTEVPVSFISPYTDAEWKALFLPHDVPHKLLKLIEFDRIPSKIGTNGFFSNGFEFSMDTEKVGLRTYSENTEFLSSIIEFGDSDGTGSTYAFWRPNKDFSLDDCPIIWLGSEGDVEVVALHFDDFLRLLTTDEISAGTGDFVEPLPKSHYYGKSPRADEYRDWLKKEFGLDPVISDREIALPAKAKYGQLFKEWFSHYCPDYD